jgi:transposase
VRDITSFDSILLHRAPVDGRKQINGLATIVESEMGKAPCGPALFAFVSKRRDLVRLLYWDKSGFAMWVKRLEKETFRWPTRLEGDVIELTAKELKWLLDGLDLQALKPHQELSYSSLA